MGQKKPKFTVVLIQLIFRILTLIFRTLFSVIYRGTQEKVSPIDNLILLDSASTLAHKIINKKLTSVEVVESFIKRIEEIKGLNAVVENRYDMALKDAANADEIVRNSGMTVKELALKYPFLGVPFSVKCSIAVKDLKHSAGSYYRKDLIAEEDADVVAQLRKAGAIPLVLTNVPELCCWWECNNKIYGCTSNPYSSFHTSGGSSGGEGALLASAGSPMGIGSDIAGSIRVPAHFNGIFGHKCTSLAISGKGHFPMPPDYLYPNLSIGPMSRFATDLLPMLKVMVTPNQRLLLNLDHKPAIEEINFYYQLNNGGDPLISLVNFEIKEKILKIVDYLKKSRNIVATKLEINNFRFSRIIVGAKITSQGNYLLPPLMVNFKGEASLIKEFLKLPFGLSRHTLPTLLGATAERMDSFLDDATLKHYLEKFNHLKSDLLTHLGPNGVLIAPTHPTAAPYHNETLFKSFDIMYSAIFSVLGFPVTHCPMGLNKEGLPIGVSIIAAPRQDRLCLAVAEELEKAFGGWVPASPSI